MTIASRGPVPKPAAERRRRNAESRAEVVLPQGVEVEAPALEGGDLHPLARAWYESLSKSAQSQIYQDSDWAYAQVVAAALSRFLSSRSSNGNLLASIQHGMTELLTTPGARLRARMEIQPTAEKPQNVTDYRARLVKGGRRVG